MIPEQAIEAASAKLAALEELLRDMEQQPPSEVGTIRGIGGIIRATLDGKP